MQRHYFQEIEVMVQSQSFLHLYVKPLSLLTFHEMQRLGFLYRITRDHIYGLPAETSSPVRTMQPHESYSNPHLEPAQTD